MNATDSMLPNVGMISASRRQALRALATTTGLFLGWSTLGTVLSSCQQQSSPQSTAGPNGSITKQQVEAALPKLEQLVKETLQKTGVPGLSLAVVYQDEVLDLKGFGIRKVGENQPIDADTIFQLASVSKPIASTIVAGVVGDGKVSWDDPIIKHDPGFQAELARPVWPSASQHRAATIWDKRGLQQTARASSAAACSCCLHRHLFQQLLSVDSGGCA